MLSNCFSEIFRFVQGFLFIFINSRISKPNICDSSCYKDSLHYPFNYINILDTILENIKSYIERNIDFVFSNKIDSALLKDSLRLHADSIAKLNLTVKNDSTTKGIAPVVTISPTVAVVIPDSVGNGTKEGLVFKVQIAAYNLPKNYSYEHLKGLGDVEKLLLNDGITRFTIGGSFKTFNEALAHKIKVKAAGQTDAFVTAIYHGERVYLEHLAKMGLIPAEDVKK